MNMFMDPGYFQGSINMLIDPWLGYIQGSINMLIDPWIFLPSREAFRPPYWRGLVVKAPQAK